MTLVVGEADRLTLGVGQGEQGERQFAQFTGVEAIERRGVLGHASVLTLTSIADRTSPVQRGKWIMEVLLGSPPPPPPPNVPALEETKAVDAGKTLSTRERMEEHRKNPACTSCHKVIDPLGLALENFDVTGAWRIKDNEVPVDAVGELRQRPIQTTDVHELRRRGLKRGMAALCVGGGQGAAFIVERP